MALTDEQRQTLLILKVGEVAGGLLASNIALLWEQYAVFAAVSATLRDLYVQRDLIDIALGTVRGAVDFTDGDHAQKASQAATALLKMRDGVVAQIAVATDEELGASGAAIGDLTTVAPQTPPTAPLVRPFGPKAEDPPYWPSPYYPERGRGRRVAPW